LNQEIAGMAGNKGGDSGLAREMIKAVQYWRE